MHREIKFRGKRIDNGEWVVGDLRYSENSIAVACDIRHFGIGYDVYSVSQETVGQFTGVKDKNGKEICEGDIVKWDECVADYIFITQIMEVLYDENSASFEPLSEYCYESFEVIGNIHDNPELLK